MRCALLGVRLLALFVLGWAGSVAAAPFGYITNERDSTVSVLDTATNTVTATVPVGTGPIGVAVSPDGARVYVTLQGSNAVSVISAATNTVTATMPVGLGPIGVAVSPDGARVYVTNSDSNAVSVINAATNTVTATVPVPFGLAVSPDGARVYVANGVSHAVMVISTATNAVTATVPVGHAPIALGQFIGPAPASPPAVTTDTDFNGDGKPDLLWWNHTMGDVTVWYLNGVTFASWAYVGLRGVPPDWQLVGSGDFNGDGYSDLLWWNHTTGDVSVWYLNGSSFIGWDYVGLRGVPSDWQVAGPK